MSRLEKGGKGGKSASRVGKNLKMLIESTHLFGTKECITTVLRILIFGKNVKPVFGTNVKPVFT